MPSNKRTAAGSYLRSCKWCQRTIQMRNMGGHYVAFENNQVHECAKPPPTQTPAWTSPPPALKVPPHSPSNKVPESLPGFRDFDFPDRRVTEGMDKDAVTSSEIWRDASAAPMGRRDRTRDEGRSAPPKAIATLQDRIHPTEDAESSVTLREFKHHPRAVGTTSSVAHSRPRPPRRNWAPLILVIAAAAAVLYFASRPPGSSGQSDRVGVPTPVSKDSANPIGASCPNGHPVKGNQTAGTRIYHVPGGEFYARTVPERCFVSGSAAEAAGFRRSAR